MADTDMWEAERERFEAEIRKVNDDPTMLERWPGGAYKHHGVDGRWGGWKMACRASRPAEVGDEGLPALPREVGYLYSTSGDIHFSTSLQIAKFGRESYEASVAEDPDMQHEEPEPLFTAEQFRQGQRDAVAADRARREKLPANADEMVALIGSHYNSMRDDKPDPNDIVYELTVHDLLSAFRWWFDEFELEDEPSDTTNKEK